MADFNIDPKATPIDFKRADGTVVFTEFPPGTAKEAIRLHLEAQAKLLQGGIRRSAILRNWRPIDSSDDLFSLDGWLDARNSGYILPSDGTGYWATGASYSWDHEVFSTPKPEWATHVIWFNK